MVDSFSRVASKLRISITDKCNFRCNFCMPTHPVWLPDSEILSFEEMVRLVKVFVSMGVYRIRLSGGEPLMRPGVEKLVGMIAEVPGVRSLTMTTNGILLANKVRALKENGLNGVTVSLHSLKAGRFEAITGTKNTFDAVLNGIKIAKGSGLNPVKVNTVLINACNEDEILDFARLAYEGNLTVRFIEYMPFDGKKFWGMEKVVSGRSIIEKIQTAYDLVKLPRERGSTAEVYSFTHGSSGEIGVITSMTAPFCSDCDRIRLKADGKVVPCLFGLDEYDTRPLLRRDASEDELARFIRNAFWKKSPGIETMLKEHAEIHHIRPMHTIGG
ncbi:MAG: GTP 3',8-cyclase MoaA [Candidatus Bathyarchaeia archaeon]